MHTLTQSNGVIDAEAAEYFLYVSGVKETISFYYHFERFWNGIKGTIFYNYVLSFVLPKGFIVCIFERPIVINVTWGYKLYIICLYVSFGWIIISKYQLYNAELFLIKCLCVPPAQMLDGSTARISMHDLFRIWKGKYLHKKRNSRYSRFNLAMKYLIIFLWRKITESMTPCSASNPSFTGNTWSLLSAIVESCQWRFNDYKFASLNSYINKRFY